MGGADDYGYSWRIRLAAARLKGGYRSNRLTVRNFLRHFGVERRDAVKVQEIRAVLDELDLVTEPDFELEWIDAPIWLKLKDETVVKPNAVGAETFPVVELRPLSGQSILPDVIKDRIFPSMKDVWDRMPLGSDSTKTIKETRER